MATQNYPTGIDTGLVSLGQPVIWYMKRRDPAATGAGLTPGTSMGAIDEAKIELEGESIIMEQGMPRNLEKKWNKRSKGKLTMVIWEQDQDRVQLALGSGATPGTSNEFGGDIDVDEWSFVMEHEMSGGQTEYYDIFKCTREGPVTFNRSPEDENKLELTFDLHGVSRDWTNDLFTNSKYRLCRRREAAAV